MNNKRKMIDVVTLAIIGAAFCAVVFLNIFQTDRPTYSESENRELAKMPKFSFSALWDGSYFRGIDSFVSDTFYQREALVLGAKKISLLYGVKGGDFIYIGQQSSEEESDDELDNWKDKLSSSSSQESEGSSSEASSESSQESSSGSSSEGSESESSNEPNMRVDIDKISAKMMVDDVLALSVEFEGCEESELEWSVSDDKVIKIETQEGGVKVTALAKGTSTITVKTPDGTSASCEITVDQIEISSGENNGEADFFPNGLFIYKDAAYVQGSYSKKRMQTYAEILEYYGELFPNSRISAVVAPLSSMVIDDPAVTSKIVNQKKSMETFGTYITEGVNYVNPYDDLFARRNEYLYFRSDHHWTALGAYYAYAKFARSVGFEPTPIENMEPIAIAQKYHGSMYTYTKDERVKEFTDVVTGYTPTKEHTMTIHRSNGDVNTYNSCILNKYIKGYGAFIGGDNPYTVIKVPDNPQNLTALVFKDSFGTAFVPFLCEHYGTVIVIDPRYADFNLCEMFADYNITDIIFMNNLQSVNSASWAKMYLRLVGVES